MNSSTVSLSVDAALEAALKAVNTATDLVLAAARRLEDFSTASDLIGLASRLHEVDGVLLSILTRRKNNG